MLPAELEGALHSLYGHYRQQFERWQADPSRQGAGATPPVFVVVCNNTSVSKLVFDYVAGWSRTLADGTEVAVPGALPLFSNVQDDRWSSRPTSILVDSQQLESGEAMSDEFKRMAATEIEEFKAEYRLRFPGRDADALTDEDLLREVMNTVGKAGKLGEQIRCVVSVSMLTEGWDANTVTHILGVRAFGTQLLCEQVVGRGLRRMSYAVNDEGRFEPEYAEVYGVPFSFIPTSGAGAAPQPGPPHTRVRALEDRAGCEITFPRLTGYRSTRPSTVCRRRSLLTAGKLSGGRHHRENRVDATLPGTWPLLHASPFPTTRWPISAGATASSACRYSDRSSATTSDPTATSTCSWSSSPANASGCSDCPRFRSS